MFTLETPIWEIFIRGTVVYLTLAVMIRLVPKRHTGNLSPNDLVALIVVGNLAGGAIIGNSDSIPDVLLLSGIVLAWDYAFNLMEYYFPALRRVVQHTPTLLIHEGVLLGKNLKKEKLTEEELDACLRLEGITDRAQVRQAVLEVDGHISVVKNEFPYTLKQESPVARASEQGSDDGN